MQKKVYNNCGSHSPLNEYGSTVGSEDIVNVSKTEPRSTWSHLIGSSNPRAVLSLTHTFPTIPLAFVTAQHSFFLFIISIYIFSYTVLLLGITVIFKLHYINPYSLPSFCPKSKASSSSSSSVTVLQPTWEHMLKAFGSSLWFPNAKLFLWPALHGSFSLLGFWWAWFFGLTLVAPLGGSTGGGKLLRRLPWVSRYRVREVFRWLGVWSLWPALPTTGLLRRRRPVEPSGLWLSAWARLGLSLPAILMLRKTFWTAPCLLIVRWRSRLTVWCSTEQLGSLPTEFTGEPSGGSLPRISSARNRSKPRRLSERRSPLKWRQCLEKTQSLSASETSWNGLHSAAWCALFLDENTSSIPPTTKLTNSGLLSKKATTSWALSTGPTTFPFSETLTHKRSAWDAPTLSPKSTASLPESSLNTVPEPLKKSEISSMFCSPFKGLINYPTPIWSPSFG